MAANLDEMNETSNKKRQLLKILLEELNNSSSSSSYESTNSFDSSESSSDDEPRVITAMKRDKVPQVENYIENVVAHYTDSDFKSHFRMTRTTVELLVQLVGKQLVKDFGHPPAPPLHQILVALWIVATPDSFRSVADRFGIPKQSVWKSTFRVLDSLMKIAPQHIVWPRVERQNEISAGFKRLGGLSNVIGAIDGSYISIRAPKYEAKSYITRKGFHAISLQAVCDHRCLFTHCYAGQVGSVHDARTYRLSDLHTLIERSPETMFPHGRHLVGDAAYPLQVHLLTPYRDNGRLSRVQKNFNEVHARTRNPIERAFGVLKGRFRQLRHLDMMRTDLVPVVIMSCCVLHNICESYKDTGDAFFVSTPASATVHGEVSVHEPPTKSAMAKRDYIAQQLLVGV